MLGSDFDEIVGSIVPEIAYQADEKDGEYQ